MTPLILVAFGAGFIFLMTFILLSGTGLFTLIREHEVGIVVKRFAGHNLPAGRLIALEGEAGFQSDTLSPGLHFGLWRWQYRVHKVPMVVIQPDEIGLVVAADGNPIPSHRILGKVVECNDFQDARQFLQNGGEKGRQLGILTAGTYRINTALFTVITSANAHAHDMSPEELEVYYVEPEMVGIVTTMDGAPISPDEIAGPVVPGHGNFQKAQVFMEQEGRRGLQEQVLLSGKWNLNPWFVNVEQVPMTAIPIGYVGVVISYVGNPHEDVSGESFKHGDLVNPGHKGVWVKPLYPGKHPLNTSIMKVELVPTTNIVLNWANRTEAHRYDAHLSSITVRSKDGFAFNLDVSQIIHIGALEASKVISRVGSMQNLVDHVLQPIVGNYFRNSAQDYIVLDFLNARSTRQTEAAQHIRAALATYDVEAVDTLIGDIDPPAELMETQTERKIAEEQRKTFAVQQDAQKQRQQLVRETSLAEIQHEMIQAEQGVTIAELNASARVKQANGEAEAIRATGTATADAYKAGVDALGAEEYTFIQVMDSVAKGNVRVVPDVQVSNGENGGGLLDGIMAMFMKRENGSHQKKSNGSKTSAKS